MDKFGEIKSDNNSLTTNTEKIITPDKNYSRYDQFLVKFGTSN